MNKLMLISLFVLGILLFFYYLISNISNKMKIDIDIVKELEKYLEKTKLDTTIKMLEKGNPCFDLEDNLIEIKDCGSVKTLSETFHEFGHAFFNNFNAHKLYNKDRELIIYPKDTTPYDKEIGLILSFLFSKSIIISLLVTICGFSMEIRSFFIVGLIFAAISAILHTVNLWEEVKASLIAREIIKFEKYLNKKEYLICNLFLINALSTYILITLFSSFLFSLNIVYLI